MHRCSRPGPCLCWNWYTTEPSSYTILSDHRVSGMAIVGSDKVWVEPGHEAIGDDPRVFLRTILNAANAAAGPGCEMERDPSEVGNGTTATGWRYVGVEYVAGRPTHHVACVGDLSVDIDLWLDIETRLILRTREPETDDGGQLIPGQFGTTEVTEITFGEQPAALFEAPEGVVHMTSEAYGAYLCTQDLRTEEEVGFGVRDCAAQEPEATPMPTPTPAAPPSLGPRPSGPAGPLAWSRASLEEDWPAPVRPEPAGGASVIPVEDGLHADPSGDTGSAVVPWVDIREVRFGWSKVIFDLVSGMAPSVDPTEQWMAYGVVVDDDRDGVPDWRYGMDNMPVDATGERPHRAWRTNLHTGRTESAPGGPYEYVGATYFDTYFPGESFGGTLSFGTNVAGGGTKGGVPGAFYAWAAVIENGRVVANDYAPDVGWLEP